MPTRKTKTVCILYTALCGHLVWLEAVSGADDGEGIQRVRSTRVSIKGEDFLLMHGNGVGDLDRIASMVREARSVPGYRSVPTLSNEDDYSDFERPHSNVIAAVSEHASWGHFDPGQSKYADGYQCPPVNWSINTPR